MHKFHRGKISSSLKIALILSIVSLVLTVVQSLTGIILPNVYGNDSLWSKTIFQGNDIVNLCIFAPLLLLSILITLHGSVKGKLFWLGMQALITYNYIYYPLAVVYNNFFLLYVAIFGVSLYSFIFGITSIDFSEYEQYIPVKGRRIIVSVMIFIFAVVVSMMWIGHAAIFIAKGVVKQEGVSMISTFDLILLAAPLMLSARWLLRGEVRGYIFSVIMTIACGLYCFVLIAYTPLAIQSHFPDAWTMLPLWIIFLVICLSAAAMLLKDKGGSI